MSIKTLLNHLKSEEETFFKIKPHLNTKYKKLNETCIYSLIFIIKFLEYNGYTLTHICLNDFEVHDQILFLIKDTHIVELYDDYYIYNETPKEKIEFLPITIAHKNNKKFLYVSVGLFMYYLITKQIKNDITEDELSKLEYSKPYYFIKNTFNKDPCLIYL
jgi:hypothetical protein